MFKRWLVTLLLLTTAGPLWSGPDPMRPAPLAHPDKLEKPSVEASHWSLKLIRRTRNQQVALLNGRLVNVGERVDGALVTRIEDDQVTLRLPDNRSLRLWLPSAQLRQSRD